MILMKVTAVCLAGLLIITAYGGEQEKSGAYPQNRDMAILRKIGHELLLTSGDSTSRILPLKKISSTEYQLYFEKEQIISPDSFVTIVYEAAKRYGLASNFTATIHLCGTKETVYTTLFSTKPEESVISCLGRNLPKDCYYLQFSFVAEIKKRSPALLIAIIMAIAVIGYFVYRRNQKKITQSANPGLEDERGITIGNTLFNPDQQYLLFDQSKVALTPTETKLLALLTNSINQVVERDLLQKEIWEKEGVIVTRSLDMFISKLRKKLQPDPSLRITVIHGKGYKLEEGSSR